MAPASSLAHAPAPEPCPVPARRDALERIASTLGVPVAIFFPDEDQPDLAMIQTADLVAAFTAITSPAARRTCLAFVRAMASS